jgi:hypothetical protein
MKNNFFKYSTITVFVFICILCSCKGKERAEYNDIGQIDLESLACDSIKDIANAFPRIEKYHGYKLKQVLCSSYDRTYALTYFTKDSISRMDITIRDIRVEGNDIFLKDAKQTFEIAQGQFKNRKATKILGEYASFSTIYPEPNSNISNYITSFKCILKNKYAVNVLICQNKSPINFESFFKDYVAQINTSKLK